MAMILHRVGHITGDGDRAGAHDCEIRDDPFRAVLADQPDPLAAADPERSQAERQPAHVACRRGPAERLIASGLLGPQKRFVAETLGLLEEHRRQAAAAVVVHFPPSLLPAFLRLSGSRRNSRWGITEIDNHKLS